MEKNAILPSHFFVLIVARKLKIVIPKVPSKNDFTSKMGAFKKYRVSVITFNRVKINISVKQNYIPLGYLSKFREILSRSMMI